jgi:hypothetical protein
MIPTSRWWVRRGCKGCLHVMGRWWSLRRREGAAWVWWWCLLQRRSVAARTWHRDWSWHSGTGSRIVHARIHSLAHRLLLVAVSTPRGLGEPEIEVVGDVRSGLAPRLVGKRFRVHGGYVLALEFTDNVNVHGGQGVGRGGCRCGGVAGCWCRDGSLFPIHCRLDGRCRRDSRYVPRCLSFDAQGRNGGRCLGWRCLSIQHKLDFILTVLLLLLLLLVPIDIILGFVRSSISSLLPLILVRQGGSCSTARSLLSAD